jgi:uncharacterized phage protein gp47/JayE
MSAPILKTRLELAQEWIRRVVAYTTRLTWFGPDSVAGAFARATGASAEVGVLNYVELAKRNSILNASGDYATQAAAERGVDRAKTTPARVLVIVKPITVNVIDITSSGNDFIEVDVSTGLAAAMEIVIRSADGATSETATIIAITSGTGANGGDELEVAPLSGTYAPTTEDVDVLAHVVLPERTVITTNVGVSFETLLPMTTGEANAVLDGEGAALALCDKVWCECTTRGAQGNVEPNSVTGIEGGLPDGIASVSNPEQGYGGADAEADYELKSRTINQGSLANIETNDWIERTAQEADIDVLRAYRDDTFLLGSMNVKILHRNGGVFSTAQKDAIKAYLEDRVRSYLTITLEEVTLTSVEIEAQITLEQGAVLEDVWRAYASKVATYLDWRKWVPGDDVDWAKLFDLLVVTDGVATVDPATFSPSADVDVVDFAIPTLARISIEDTATNDTINAELAESF